ncbi:LCP family protein [Candidatus Saccharibacteria bacterium]|nr:LCP family protein [Candidatus Saccharibacteria bacterium]
MVSKSARTIDGMRVQRARLDQRTVGFDAPKKRPVNSRKTTEAIGLSREDIGKEKARLVAKEDFLKPVSTLDFDLSSKELRPDYSLKKRDDYDTQNNKKKRGKKTPGKKHPVRIALIVILVILVLGVGAFAIWGNDLISKLTGGRSGLFEFIGAISSNVELKTDANGRTNVLIYGTSGYDMEGTEGDYAHDGAMLTDSIMVLSLDQKTNDVAMINLPRDLYVGNTCTSTGKVNEVFWCANIDGNDEEGGATALMNTIKSTLGVDIQYWVHLDWAALIQVVDGIGGVTVTLDEDIADPWTQTYIKAGEPTTLNGERALGLARARHGTTMGDFSRGNSQQKILVAIQKKIMEEGIDFGQALGLVEAVGDNVRMSFNIDEIKTVLSIAKDMSLEDMRQVALVDYENNIYYVTTDEMNGISYVVPAAGMSNYSEIKKYVAKMFSSNPAVREGAVIAVLNGSGEVGVASEEKVKLTNDGYVVEKIGDAPEGEYGEAYFLYHISGKTPGTAKALENRYATTVRGAEELPAGIDTTGIDIVIIVGKPADK